MGERTMIAGRFLMCAALAATVALGLGCEPTRNKIAWVNPLDTMEPRLAKDPKDNNYILQRMEFGRMAVMLGSDLRAKPHLMEAFDQLGAERDNTAAALTTEQLKFYKGETYERAMLATYLGLLEYRAGQYNNARILFSRALSADRAAVVNEKTPSSYGEDFGLAYFWISRAFAKLGDADQCAIALRKAAAGVDRPKTAEKELAADRKAVADWEKKFIEGEKWSFQTFSDPKEKDRFMEGIVDLSQARGTLGAPPAAQAGAAKDNPVLKTTDKREEFFTPAYQNEANTVLQLEVGWPPYKYLGGINGERTEFGRSFVQPRTIRVYVDGHYAGQAFEVLDLWEQASTQDRIAEKDAAQAGKAVAKEILKHMPYVGSAAGYWNVQGDIRYWHMLPGKVFIYAGKLAPGPHTVRLEMYDVAGNLLPRWTNTFYGLGVPKEGEALISLVPHADGDNRLPPELVEKALKAGAKPVVAGGMAGGHPGYAY
jgi:tetratricopeptide (TPR) repeat protein